MVQIHHFNLWVYQSVNCAAYIVLGVTTEGYKDILSITVGANETSKFWLGMLNDLENRGVKDVIFFCVDGLAGFKEAIQAVYPHRYNIFSKAVSLGNTLFVFVTFRYWQLTPSMMFVVYIMRLISSEN